MIFFYLQKHFLYVNIIYIGIYRYQHVPVALDQALALCYVSLRELPICHRACEPASVTPPWPWMSLLLQPGPESPTRLLTCEALYLAHGHKGYPQVAKFHSLRSNQLRYIR